MALDAKLEKKKVIDHLIEFLEEDLREAESVDQKKELASLITMYRFLPSREYAPTEPIVPTSLITLRIGQATTYAFIVPRGGGFITQIDGVPLQVLTPNSPLGEALFGKKTGDRVQVEVRGQTRDYLIVASA